ncbi:NADH-quinone oxidoreductase subunit NuoN [Halalkalibacterium ligniniphilum]|uniref:NADH-quinone oxidoreductase subunit NuoN n=2 Tax=Halalkalibacterium ligniniphilum TaxID=1134413 RepID=UPI00034C6140|nr:NADH-quinone oxidoreductase subunit NuoN [Halalkalibacterium ligniniphilum]
MDLQTMLSYPWGVMAPEFTIFIAAAILSILDLALKEKVDRKMLNWLAIAAVVLALLFSLRQLGAPVQMILYETYRLDSVSLSFKLLLLLGTLSVLVLSFDVKKEQISHRSEYIYLILTALLGAMIMASSADLLTLFVGLELLSLSSYVLVGLKKTALRANEAAFKYYVNGGVATAFTLFGMSYVYGLTGQTNLFEIGAALQQPAVAENLFLLVIAFVMMIGGLMFKIAGIPFHMWAPDVYDGAATPIAAFLSVVSKIAGFAMLLRIVFVIFASAPNATLNQPFLLDTQWFFIFLAATTILVGNLLALKEYGMKRLFAYSSIAQAGYVLVPLAALTVLVFENIWFYLFIYLLMNVGAFAIIQVVLAHSKTETIAAFAGLYQRSPFLAMTMTGFLLSLAGIPLTAGFMGKYFIFVGALSSANYFLAGVMVAGSVLSYVYYFRIVTQIFARPPESEEVIQVPLGIRAVITVAIAAVIGLGLFPNLAFEFFFQYFQLGELL